MKDKTTDWEEYDEPAEGEVPRPDPERLREFVGGLPLPSPREIFEQLGSLGYKGQEPQRRALSLMAYRHVRRLKAIHAEGAARRDLPPKQNCLLVGPTGCGKTFLVELLFGHIFRLPTVVVDITSYTESGYVGDDVRTVLARLVDAADGDHLLASCGVVCLDEFDKIASSTSNARFAGQGTTKDVSGYGVQRELLAMVEGADVLVPMDYGFSQFGYRLPFSTRDVPFIACGAFAGFEELLKAGRAGIGFRGGAAEDDASSLTLEEVGSFHKFGFLPELIGRFSRIVKFPELPRETLRLILDENVLPQYVSEFALEGLKLTVTDEALDHIIARSQRRGTGARGLNSELVGAVERAAFATFGGAGGSGVVVSVSGGRLETEVRGPA